MNGTASNNLNRLNNVYLSIIRKKGSAKIKTLNDVLNFIEEVSKITEIPLYYFMYSKDKRTGYYNIGLHYTFFIDRFLQKNKMVKYYSVETNIDRDNEIIVCSVLVEYKKDENSDYITFKYDLFDSMKSKEQNESGENKIYRKEDYKKQVIMLQKTAIMNTIKLLFPEEYMVYNAANQTVILDSNPNPGYYEKREEYTTKKSVFVNNTKQTMQVDTTDKVNNLSQEQTKSENETIKEKYRKIFIGIRDSNNIPEDEFNKMVKSAMEELGKKPVSEEDFIQLHGLLVKHVEEKITQS
ncbi:MAG: hypothetical protein QXF12_01005 [Candidatus Aenigmatarchaeota archaeon]